MPISQYDRWFGGNAEKAYRSMVQQYGPEKGRSVFYAVLAERKKKHGGAFSKMVRSSR